MRRDDDTDGGPERDWTERTEGPSGKLVVLLAIVVVLAVFVLQNTNDADLNFLFWDVQIPLWIVLAVTAGLGFVGGWAVARLRSRTD